MPSLAKIDKRLARQFALLNCNRLDDDASTAEKCLRLSHAFGPKLVLDHHRQLYKVSDADTTGVGNVNALRKSSRLWLAVEDCD